MRQLARDLWEIIREPLKGVAIGAFLFWMVLVAFVHAQEGVTWQWSHGVVEGAGRRARIPVRHVALVAEPKGEVEWVEQIAKTLPFSEVEHRLPNDRRVDIVWNGYAVEADWDSKFFEGYAQAVYYARWMRLKPALLLLVKSDNPKSNIQAARFLCGDDVVLWIYDTRDDSWMVKPE